MPFLETLALIAAIKSVHTIIKSLNSPNTPSLPSPSLAKPPEKIITFIGATNTGKSSTINALFGYTVFPVNPVHGTTTSIAHKEYKNGYRLQDTPGLRDSIDYSNLVWQAIESSELVIYTVTGQLYRSEIEIIEEISRKQFIWDIESSTSDTRKLALYVNKQDVKENTMPSSDRLNERRAIQEQVQAYINPARVIYGASSPVKNGDLRPSQIQSLEELILRHISS